MPSTKKTAASRPKQAQQAPVHVRVHVPVEQRVQPLQAMGEGFPVMASPMGSPPACRISSKGHNALQRSPCIKRSWHPVLFCSRNFLPRMPAEHVQKSVRQERALTQGSAFAPLRTGRAPLFGRGSGGGASLQRSRLPRSSPSSTIWTCSWRIRFRRTCRRSSCDAGSHLDVGQGAHVVGLRGAGSFPRCNGCTGSWWAIEWIPPCAVCRPGRGAEVQHARDARACDTMAKYGMIAKRLRLYFALHRKDGHFPC